MLSENEWWAGQDLNLRPQPRKGCVLTTLDYRPVVQNYGIKCFIKSARELKASPANLFLSRVGWGATYSLNIICDTNTQHLIFLSVDRLPRLFFICSQHSQAYFRSSRFPLKFFKGLQFGKTQHALHNSVGRAGRI